MISTVIGWILKSAILTVSIIQILVMHSNYGQYCIKQLEVLGIEGQWLQTIVVMQISKVVVFTIWWLKITYGRDDSRNTYNRESIYSDIQANMFNRQSTNNGDGKITARMHDIAKRNLQRIPTQISGVDSESLSDKSKGSITEESVVPISAY